MTAERKRVVVLISGRGSNMAALVEAAKEETYPGEIVGVVADKPDAEGLKLAEANGLPTSILARSDFSNRPAHEAAIEETLRDLDAEIVALAGYMRLLSPAFTGRWAGRLLNIHPALLPAFTGLDTHRRALAAGVRVHGCTVHFVTAAMDDGPIIAQAAVPVFVGDDEASLSARVLKAEHRLYPLALAMVCRGEARMAENGTVFTLPGTERSDPRYILAPEFSNAVRNVEDLARFTP
jgi:formyltetrahydrofolate-dependent phosphoribosylglycinamide formyltransferase